MYLVDTNIFLELLLEQEKANFVRTFLRKVDSCEINLSELSLYSIGIILFKLKKNKSLFFFY